MAPKRRMRSSSPPGSPPAEPTKRKRPTSAVRRLEKPEVWRQGHASGGTPRQCTNAAAQRKPVPQRYVTCAVPKRMPFADNSIIQEVMPDLERMRLRTLVNRPWQVKAKFACQELLDFVNQTRPFPASHRVHLAKFDKRSLAALYDLPSKGHYIYPRQAASTFVCELEGFPSKYFTGQKPDQGWFYRDVRDPRLRKVCMVLNPIFCPNKRGQITRSMAMAVCMAWVGEDIDWAQLMSDKLEPLTTNFGLPKKCYLSPYLLHTYQNVEALSMMEDYQIRKAINNLNEEAMGTSELAVERKQKLVAEARGRAKVDPCLKEQRGKGSGAQEHEFCTCDVSDASSASMCSMCAYATRSEDSEDFEKESDDVIDDNTGRAEEKVRLDQSAMDDPIEVDVVSLGADTDVQVDDAEALGGDVNVQLNDSAGQPKQKTVVSGSRSGDQDVLQASSEEMEKRSEIRPPGELKQNVNLKTNEEILGSSQKEQAQSFLAADSGLLLKLFLPTVAKMEQVLSVVTNNLGCTMEETPSRIAAVQNEQAKLLEDLRQTQKRLETSLQNESSLKEQLASSILEERAGTNSAATVIQRLKNDLDRSQKVSDDALSTLKGVREDELSAMNRVYALNMSTLDSAVGRFQNLLQDFEMAVPGGLENVIKRKLKDLSVVDHDLLLHIVVNEVASAGDTFGISLAESKKELESLFVQAKEMRSVLCSSNSKVSGGTLHSLSTDPKLASNDLATAGAIARQVLFDAGVQLRKEKQRARCAQGSHEQSRPFPANASGSPSGSRSAVLEVKDETVTSTDRLGRTGA